MTRRQTRLAIVWLLATAVVIIGVWLQAVAGAPRSAQILQSAGGAVALVLIWLVPRIAGRISGSSAWWGVGLAAVGLLILPLFQPAMEGVHRWFWLGPVAIQPLPLALPLLVWLTAQDDVANARWSAPGPICLALAALALVFQPDQQGAVAVLVAALAMVLPWNRPVGVNVVRRWLGVGLAVCCWVASAFRPDSLEPVAWVEGVVQMALDRSPLFGAVAILALIASVLLIAACAWIPGRQLASGRPGMERTGWLLAVAWTAMVLAGLSGLFPVPVIGYGVSWVVGWGLTLGLALASRAREITGK